MKSRTIKPRTLLVVTGPTAVGKTDYTISLAEHLGTVIISADSRQMFREMSIGTARPTAQELARVPHYFVGTLSIHDYYNVSIFEQQVLQLLETLFVSHPVVIMTGGSPQYIDAVCKGIDEMPDPNPVIREHGRYAMRMAGRSRHKRECVRTHAVRQPTGSTDAER